MSFEGTHLDAVGLARLKKADDAYFDAVVALEIARENALQQARIALAKRKQLVARRAIDKGGATPARKRLNPSQGKTNSDRARTSSARRKQKQGEIEISKSDPASAHS